MFCRFYISFMFQTFYVLYIFEVFIHYLFLAFFKTLLAGQHLPVCQFSVCVFCEIISWPLIGRISASSPGVILRSLTRRSLTWMSSTKTTYLLQHENKTNTSLSVPGALAHRLQRRTACKKVSTPRFLGILSNFR